MTVAILSPPVLLPSSFPSRLSSGVSAVFCPQTATLCNTSRAGVRVGLMGIETRTPGSTSDTATNWCRGFSMSSLCSAFTLKVGCPFYPQVHIRSVKRWENCNHQCFIFIQACPHLCIRCSVSCELCPHAVQSAHMTVTRKDASR